MIALIAALLTGACSKTEQAPPPSLPLVEVSEVVQKDVPIYQEWVGTLDGMVNAQILAVAIYPLHHRLSMILGGREALSATLITSVLLMSILGRCGFLADMMGDNIRELTSKLQQNQLSIPEPPEKVAAWPLVGKPIFNFWHLAATNFGEAVKTFAPQLKRRANGC